MANRFLAQANTDEPPTCPGCQKMVLPKDRPLTALKATWHPGCLKCTQCGTTLNVRSLESYQNQPYCRPHRPNPTSTAVKANENIAIKNALSVPKAARKEQGFDKTSRMTFAPGQVQPGQFNSNQSNSNSSGSGSIASASSSYSTPKPQLTGGSIKDRIANLSVQDNNNNNNNNAPPKKNAPPPVSANSKPMSKFTPPPPRQPEPEPEPEPEPVYEEEQQQEYEEPQQEYYDENQQQQEYNEGGDQQYYDENQQQQEYYEGGDQQQEYYDENQGGEQQYYDENQQQYDESQGQEEWQ